MSEPINYAKLDYHARRHHERFTRRVNSMARKLVCQECGGAGGHVEPVLDYGQGPWEPCGWCEGTGLVDRWRRAMWLAWKREQKARAVTRERLEAIEETLIRQYDDLPDDAPQGAIDDARFLIALVQVQMMETCKPP